MEIPEIKARLSILTVLEHYNLKTNKNGMLCCPFHDDKTPSMQIYPKTNTYCCFSSNCTAGTGDVIDFFQLKEKCSKHQAILKAKELLGVSHKNTDNFSRGAMIQRFWESCRSGLKNNRSGQGYLAERCIKEIRAGYCGHRSMQHWQKHLQRAAEEHGLLKDGRPHFQNCVVFPLVNVFGKTVGLYGRSIQSKKHVYLQGGHQGLYPCYPKKDSETVVLTESVIDAATLMVAGIDTPLALYGTNGFTEEHVQALQRLKKLKEIILFMDGDAAGKSAVEKYSEKLYGLFPNISISAVDTPEGEDINSLAVNHGTEAKELLKHLIDERKVLFITSIEKKTTEESPEPNSLKADNPNKQLNSQNPNNLVYTTPEAELSVKGGIHPDLTSLKISLHITSLETGRKYRSKVDLYEARQTQKLSQDAGEALHIRPNVLQTALEELTDLLEKYREETPKEEKNTVTKKVNPTDRHTCLEFLKAPFLLEGLNTKIGEAGVTGEENNRLFLLGIATSYKMPVPLHALIQGSSGSGKTHLLASISRFIPPEDCIALTRVTDSSFYNYGEHDLSHKLVCFEDLDGLKEDALLAVRELISRGQLTSSTSGKDDKGNIQSYVRTVYGPIASLSCTTQGETYEDNMGRCFLIAVDESSRQTKKIIDYQNKKAAGQVSTKKEAQATAFLQNCIRLLQPYEVVNPFAEKVKLPEKAHKIRRLNGLYQSYVQQVTLLHQYQRKQDRQGRLISTVEDLKAACKLMFESIVLKVDELDGSLRQFYEALKSHVIEKENTFTQREVRQALNISKTQLQRYLYQLQSLEYIRQCGGYSNTGYQYKIVYWDDNTALRRQIREFLNHQLASLGRPTGHHGPPQGHQNGTKVLNTSTL